MNQPAALPVDGLDFRDLDERAQRIAIYAKLCEISTKQEDAMARDQAFRQLFNTVSTEHQETLTSARGAIDRIAAQVADLQTKVQNLEAGSVSDDAMTEFTSGVDALKTSADDAQSAFDKIGVPATEPVPSDGTEPVPPPAP